MSKKPREYRNADQAEFESPNDVAKGLEHALDAVERCLGVDERDRIARGPRPYRDA
jgi:hypothetical protein